MWVHAKGSLGDEIGLTGAIREKKRQCPDEMIRIWGKYRPGIWENNPYLGIGNKDDGMRVTCHSFYRDHVGTRVELNFDLLGVDRARVVDGLPEFWWTAEELARPIFYRKGETSVGPIEDLIPAGAGRIVAVDPCAGWPSREWPHEQFDQLCEKLSERGYYVVQVGAAGPRPLRGTRQNLAKRLGLRDLARWLGRVDLFVGNDSGLFHIAAAVGTPHVTIYGLTRRTCGPYSTTVPVSTASECGARCFQYCNRRDANKNKAHCMTEIPLGAVLDACELALSRPRPPSRLVPAPSKAEVYAKFMAAAAAPAGA